MIRIPAFARRPPWRLPEAHAPEDLDEAERRLLDLTSDTGDDTNAVRRDIAIAIRQITDPRFQRLLIPLLYDPAIEVADEAMESVHAAGTADFIFVPTLVSLLRNRRLKGRARVVARRLRRARRRALAFFLRDPEEDIWVRRHIPGTLAQIPSQKTVDVLLGALEERDGFIRYKVVSALERLRRENPELTLPAEPIEKAAIQEARRYLQRSCRCTTTCSVSQKLPADSLLSQALLEQMTRLRNRIFKLLTLALLARRHRCRAIHAGSRRRPRQVERVGVSRQHPLDAVAQAGPPCPRGHAARRARAPRQRPAQDPAA